MPKKSTVQKLKKVISAYESGRLPKTVVALEYEAHGTFYFSAFTHKGFETHRYALSLWTDSDGAVIGRCSCAKKVCCRHLRKAAKQFTGH